MLRRILFSLALVALALTLPGSDKRFFDSDMVRAADTWPYNAARAYVMPEKTGGKEITDVEWLHLHEGDMEALDVDLHVKITDYQGNSINGSSLPAGAPSGWVVRYMVHGVAVSGWLSHPGTFTLDWDDADLDALGCNGIHDVAVEVDSNTDFPPTGAPTYGATADYQAARVYLHIHRTAWSDCETVPIINQSVQTQEHRGGVIYVDVDDRDMDRDYGLLEDVEPFTGFPARMEDLYQEDMQPHSDLFGTIQMWWQEPEGTHDAGLKFVRGLFAKASEYTNELYYGTGPLTFSEFGYNGHRTFPVKDGPRGIGWTNGYIQGVADATGHAFFANTSGQVRVMEPDGELHTIAGWRVDPDKDPVWVLKPLNSIRESMELRGNWPGNDSNATELARSDPGFHQPMDVAIDPNDDTKLWIAGGYDHCIYEIVFSRTTWEATSITVLAGQRGTPGFANGTGTSAQFW